MQRSSGEAAAGSELSVAEKLNEMARETARLAEATASRMEDKLAPLCWPVDSTAEKLGISNEEWPDYFASLREYLQEINKAQLRIQNALDRTGI